MARLDEMDKYYERIEQALYDRSNNASTISRPSKPYVPQTAEEEVAWEARKTAICEEISQGATSGKTWILQDTGFVYVGDFPGGEFEYNLPLPRINDERIRKFLKAHGLELSNSVIWSLRQQVFGLADAEVKLKLKEFILARKRGGAANLRT